MFKRLRLRIQDIKTINKLIPGADKQARMSGEEEPGAEHFLLSAFELPEGSARRVFERAGADPDKFRDAIGKQYSDALQAVGIDADAVSSDIEPVETARVFNNSKPSGQAVMKALYNLKKNDKDKPLLGAHVVAVVANMQHGVAARALRVMGVNQEKISRAVSEELDSIQR